jgi:hypothetical protein
MNQAAHRTLQEVIARSEEPAPSLKRPQRKHRKNPHAVALGRRGGLKGGKARAAKMTPEELKASALKAIRARWAKPR